MKHDLTTVLAVLPQIYRAALEAMGPDLLAQLEELRLRAGRPVSALVGGTEWPLSVQGNPISVQPEHLRQIVASACGQSVYASAEPIAQGYLTLQGGHRLGLCGSVVSSGGTIGTIREFSSLNIRLARAKPGCAGQVTDILRAEPGSVLLIGPPGSGKTTLLRDLVRQISDRLSMRVGLVDERGELAAVWNGVPQFDVGRLTDVMSGGEKSAGMIRLLRSMNPQYLAIDEISSEHDLQAMQQAGYCGVYLAATAHAFDREELLARPIYRKLLEQRLFSHLVTLQPDRTLKIERLEGT